MQYTIYKLSGKFNSHRWWRNYDANNIGTPDIDIETYITNKSLTWSELKNSRNENIKYETISKDSFDKIQLYLADIKDIPDYIKITFTKDAGVTESMYYYVDTPPSIYNSQTKLSSIVTYTLDKKASYYFKFHTKLKTDNPNMFFVRKHTPRYLYDTTTNKYYFDLNKQPWYLDTKDDTKLIVDEKLQLTTAEIAQNNFTSNVPNYTFSLIDHGTGTPPTLHRWKWTSSVGGSTGDEFYAEYILGVSGSAIASATRVKISDDQFRNESDGHYEYIITKANGWRFSGEKLTMVDKYFAFPIVQSASAENWGSTNNTFSLYTHFPVIFNDDNVVGRFISYQPPSSLIVQEKYAGKQNEIEIGGINVLFIGGSLVEITNSALDQFAGCIIVDGIPSGFELPTTSFKTKLSNCINNINNNNVAKTKENNPHLLAPQYLQLQYLATSNNLSTLTSDYINLLDVENSKIKFETMVATDFYSRLRTSSWNQNKLLSQSGNELTCSDGRIAPIQCTAWNNTWLQRQAIDTGRNAQVKSATTSFVLGGIGTALSIASLFFGPVGALAGVGGLIGSLGGIAKGAVNLENGRAQVEQQKANLYSQPNTLNNPLSISGLSSLNTWSDGKLTIYTLACTEQDKNIINNDDNMYGYPIKSWLPYTDYQTCWDGNYMLCDMKPNYSNIFNKLKSIDSMFTIDDNYVNDFIGALNNGITWYDDGNYVDLATDDYNWERTFPRHV